MAGWVAGWLAGRVIIIPLRDLSCKLRLSRFSAELKFQDRPSVAKSVDKLFTLIVFLFTCSKAENSQSCLCSHLEAVETSGEMLQYRGIDISLMCIILDEENFHQL